MASRSVVLFGLALVAACGMSMAQVQPPEPGTTGARFSGYTFVSSVTGYVNMTLDYCDMLSYLSAGQWEDALSLYTLGKNSARGAGKRTFFLFASHVASEAEPCYAMFMNGRNASFLDDMIRVAFAAKNAPLVLGLIHVATLKYMLHELDEGAVKIASYLEDPITYNSSISVDGAPHNIDEAFALWAGGSATACDTLERVSQRLGVALDATFVNRAFVANGMTIALNELQGTARLGDLAAYSAARANVTRLVSIVGLQGVMQAVYAADLATRCKRPAADLAEARAAVVTHWTYLRAFLEGRKMAEDRILPLEKALMAPKLSFAKTWPALKLVIHSMGRRVAEVGMPNFKAINGNWNCPYSAAPKY